MFSRKPAPPLVVPENIDWYDRAMPNEVADRKAGHWHMRDYLKVVEKLRTANLGYLQQELKDQNGVLVGYHGTTTRNAKSIMENGFENRRDEEGYIGVSAWANVAARRAADFARDRSVRAGAYDEGRIIEVRMQNPKFDGEFGRLELLGKAENTEPLRVYTPEELVHLLGGVSLSHIHGVENFVPQPQAGHAIV